MALVVTTKIANKTLLNLKVPKPFIERREAKKGSKLGFVMVTGAYYRDETKHRKNLPDYSKVFSLSLYRFPLYIDCIENMSKKSSETSKEKSFEA